MILESVYIEKPGFNFFQVIWDLWQVEMRFGRRCFLHFPPSLSLIDFIQWHLNGLQFVLRPQQLLHPELLIAASQNTWQTGVFPHLGNQTIAN
jgi:hypothetical protein